MSVRELARQHGIPSERVSSIHDAARKPDSRGKTWYDKREDFRNQSSDVTMKKLADLESKRRVRRIEVADHAIEVIDKAIGVLSKNLDPVTTTTEGGEERIEFPKVQIRDLAMLLDRLNPLFGQPTTLTLTEGRTIHASGPPELGDGILAGLAALTARPVGPGVLDAAPAPGGPLPSAPGPRPNE